MEFEAEYQKFIEFHCTHRSGTRLERLRSGLGHAEKLFIEKVWWPAFQHFDGLHPEYEIHDFKDDYRYIDFAFIHTHFRIAIEIDGLGPHWRNIDRWKFSDHCQRQNHLMIDGWHVLRFSTFDVEEHPRQCQQMVHQLMGRLLGRVDMDIHSLQVMDREIILFTLRRASPVTPSDVSALLHISVDTAILRLRKLVKDTWLEPASGIVRVRSYKLHPSKSGIQL